MVEPECSPVENYCNYFYLSVPLLPISASPLHNASSLFLYITKNAIFQFVAESVLTAANRVESEWSHESPSFSCVAVDASVEQVYSCPPSSSSPSSSSRLPNMEDLKGEPSNLSSPVHHTASASGLGSASRSRSSSSSSSSRRRGVDLKFTHAALYSKHTTRTRIVRDTRSAGATSHNPSQNSPSIIGTGVKGRMGSAVLGDYSTIAMQTLLTDKAESRDSSSGVTADAAGMADMSEGDPPHCLTFSYHIHTTISHLIPPKSILPSSSCPLHLVQPHLVPPHSTFTHITLSYLIPPRPPYLTHLTAHTITSPFPIPPYPDAYHSQ